MPYLGDFLGHIMAEITIARMQADMEALRVADYYASHPLMRNLPIPRFRLSDFDIDLPVVIDQVEETDGGPPRGGLIFQHIFDAYLEVLATLLLKYKIRVSNELREKLRFVVKNRIDYFSKQSEIATDASLLANDLSKTTTREILAALKKTGKRIDQAKMKEFSNELRDEARVAILRYRTVPPRLHVLVTTREIKEAGPSENIGQLKIRLHEESLEWSLIEREDHHQEQLIPE